MSYPQTAVRIPVNAVSKTAGSTTVGLIDRMLPDGSYCSRMTIDIIGTTADVVSNKPTVLKLQEADTTDLTNLVNIAGMVGGTDFTIPNANTAATAIVQNAFKFNVDCRARKRYIAGVISPATTQTITMVANLSHGGVSLDSAAKANAMVLVEG